MARILIIDDDVLFGEMLVSAMVLRGHEALAATTVTQGREALTSGGFDIVFLDVLLPDGNGLKLLPDIREDISAPEIIIITGAGDADGAEIALRNGALNYLQKPASLATMTQAVERALAFRQSKGSGAVSPDRIGLVGKSASMMRCFQLMGEAAASDVSVLICGDTGTGKELFARAIHQNSTCSEGPFVVVDCAAIAKPLIESELFGYERGAFTGADVARDGLIQQAHGGTLFLDEIGELPVLQQKALLRVLQEHRFRPVGAKEEKFSDFRVVAATNRDLGEMAERGLFRKDLLFRLQAVRLDLPPLRERGNDISELAISFAEKLCRHYALVPKVLSRPLLKELAAYPWPGNVRELRNVIEQCLLSGRSADTLLPEHLPSHIRVYAARGRLEKHSVAKPVLSGTLPSWKEYKEVALASIEREYLIRVLNEAGGKVSRASEIANISRQRLYTLLRKHAISRGWQTSGESNNEK